MGEQIKLGVIGCGFISAQYFETLRRLRSVELVAVADLNPEAAREAATREEVTSLSVGELLDHPGIDTILNLTIPAAHAEVSLLSIRHGKNVYSEKPLATSFALGSQLLTEADEVGVTVSAAPDTVLGTGIQTARRALDEGKIGEPVAATAIMAVPGHELWHPNPDFYYAPGGGPLFDMGPYYITALITLLGPVVAVSAMSSRSRQERVLRTGPRSGAMIPVEVDTHWSSVLRHESGALSTMIMSFDSVATLAAPIEVHGTEASMGVPDPNLFEGPVSIRRLGEDEWATVPASAGYLSGSRGIGLADLASSSAKRGPRANGQLALHVLQIMESVVRSSDDGRVVTISSRVDRPEPVPLQEAE